MSREAWSTLALVVALIVVAAVAWSFELRPPLRVDAAKLGAFPKGLDEWEAYDVPLESGVESMLRADINLQRVYLHPLGDLVWLYVGYYSTDRGGAPEHTPETCYPSSGWRIVEQRRVAIDENRALRANEFVVEKAGERRLVHFWYRSYRTASVLGLFGLGVDHFVGRIEAGRADGALVRISTPLDADDEITARSRLFEFARSLENQLATAWPEESPSR